MSANGKKKQRRSNDCSEEKGREEARWKRDDQEPSSRQENHEYLRSYPRTLLPQAPKAALEAEKDLGNQMAMSVKQQIKERTEII